jgi:HK97 gp10 family phage protein
MKVEGLAELKDVLRTLPDATAKNILRRVAKKGLQPIIEHAASLAPKHLGFLARSVVVTNKLSRRQKREHRKWNENDVEMFGGFGPLRYAAMNEYGTHTLKPRPFLRPAWDTGKERLFLGIKDDLWKEIEKAVARRARKAAK